MNNQDGETPRGCRRAAHSELRACGTSKARPVCAPLPTGVAPTSRYSLCPFLLCGSLSRAFARLSCTSCRRRLCVGVHLLGTFPRSSPTRTLDGLHGVDELFESHRVMDVGSAKHHRQRDAPSVRNKVALGALLSFIRRILTGFWAPLLAGMEAESSEARSQSIWPASPRQSRRTRCSLSHTPASCHSLRRLQQVIPEPQPIS
jgi:hypothetical protein